MLKSVIEYKSNFPCRIPRLQEIITGVGLTVPAITSILSKYFFRICRTFGRTFVDKMVNLY